jgi:hypothetical protein
MADSVPYLRDWSFCLTPSVSLNSGIVAVNDETYRVKDHTPNERMTERLAHAKEQARARA